MVLGNGHSGMRQSHCCFNWTKYRVFTCWMPYAGTLGFWALLIQNKALEFTPIMTIARLVSWCDVLAEPVYTIMPEIITSPADGTTVIELPRIYPFRPAVSWRMAHGSGWVIFLHVKAPLTQSALFHWSFSCLHFQSLLVFGLLGNQYCNDRARSRLHLGGKWNMPFLGGSLSFYNWCITLDQHWLEGFRVMGQVALQCHSQPHVHITFCNSTCFCLYSTKPTPGQDAKLFLKWIYSTLSKERAWAIFLAIQMERWTGEIAVAISETLNLDSACHFTSENLNSSFEPCLGDQPCFPKHIHRFNLVGPRKAFQTHMPSEPLRRCHDHFCNLLPLPSWTEWPHTCLQQGHPPACDQVRERLECIFLPMQWDMSVSPLLPMLRKA